MRHPYNGRTGPYRAARTLTAPIDAPICSPAGAVRTGGGPVTSKRTDTVESSIGAAYATLLAHPELDLPEFARKVGCTPEEAALVLDRLAELSLIGPGPTAINPVFAMQQILGRERDRQRQLQETYSTLSSALSDYATRPTGADPHTERIAGLAAVRQRLEGLAAQSTREVVSFSPGAVNPTDTRAAGRPLDLDALRRGVRMRTLYLDVVTYDPAALTYAAELVEAGAQIRVVPELPLRLIVVDRTIAVVPVDPANGTAGALVLRDPGTVTALLALFEAYWATGRDLTAPCAGCGPVELSILRLLATGAKDEAVARQLGLSVRTVRRGIAELMEQLRAGSRFELGARAAERGWI